MPLIPSYISGVYLGDLFWSESEYSSKKKFLKWEELDISWDDIDVAWEDIFAVGVSAKRGGGGMGSPYRAEEDRIYEKGNPWKINSKDIPISEKATIKVFCRINGIDYEQKRDYYSGAKVSINELERFVSEKVRVKIDYKKNI